MSKEVPDPTEEPIEAAYNHLHNLRDRMSGDLYDEHEEVRDFSDDDSDDSVTTKELFDYQADVLHDCYKEQFGDEDNSDGGPATELLTNMDIPSINKQTIDVDGRPLDDLFGDHGRVMADNDCDHDRVVTMSDVEAEIQSLAERVTELERGEQQ